MSLLESVIGSLVGGGTPASPMGNVLSGLLGGRSSGVGGTGAGGGLGGLVAQFQQAGLGHIAQSWVGNGANQPVSPQQLRDVFGQDSVDNMASQAGIPSHDFLAQLSQHLPNAVNGMTPDGRLPDEGTMSV